MDKRQTRQAKRASAPFGGARPTVLEQTGGRRVGPCLMLTWRWCRRYPCKRVEKRQGRTKREEQGSAVPWPRGSHAGLAPLPLPRLPL